jgi:hypothetical protein
MEIPLHHMERHGSLKIIKLCNLGGLLVFQTPKTLIANAKIDAKSIVTRR